MVLKIILFLGLFFLYFNSNSQPHIYAKGKVVNNNTGKEIAFAHICVNNLSFGLITNEYGEFYFKIPSYLINENLSFSAIGYATYEVPINQIDTTQLHICLEPRTYELNSVAIKKKGKRLSAREIVKKAIERIEANYSTSPHLLKGYYRDYLKNEKESYINLLESALIMQDSGLYTNDLTNNVKLEQLKYNSKYDVEFSLNKSYDNIMGKYIPGYTMPTLENEFVILRVHNPIRRYKNFSFSFINTLNKDFIRNHNFKRDSISYLNDEKIFCISFKYIKNEAIVYDEALGEKEYKESFNITGKLFIRADNFAFIKMIYTNHNIKTKEIIYELILEYQEYKEKMYLNYISFSNMFIKQLENNDSIIEFLPKEKIPPKVLYAEVIDKYHMRLTFSKSIDKNTAEDFGNYQFLKKNNPNKATKKQVKRYPNKAELVKGNVVYLWVNSQNLEKPWINLKVTNIKDNYGNEISDSIQVPFTQFREFFVNEIITHNFTPLKEIECLDNHKAMYYNLYDYNNDFWNNYNYVINEPLKE